MNAGTCLGFADEMRVGLRGMVRRVWGRRGVKVVQRLQLSYKWCYLFLVVDARAGKLYWCWNGSMAAEEVVATVRALKQRTAVEALVWDGAPSHRDAEVGALGMPLIALPPYSPELNPAERVLEELRRAVEGAVYATLADKVVAVETTLQTLEAEPACVRSLAGWDWINTAVERLADVHAA